MRLPRLRRRDLFVGLGSLVAAGLLAGLAALVFVAAGGVDVAASRPHGWLTTQLLHFAFNRSVATRTANVLPPADLAAPSRAALGAQHFQLVCSNCHGAPGLGQSPVALSMTPRPQHLPAVVGQFSDAELFWIVKHGVKFSAMPAWTTQGRDDEVWSLVAFLRTLPKTDAAAYLKATAAPLTAEEAPKIPVGDAVSLTEADTLRDTYPADEHLYAAPAIAFGDKTILADALAVCSRCHGPDGTGGVTGGEAPNLTIQSAEYVEAGLRAYVRGERHSGFMQPVATEMSADQLKAVAAHFGALPPKPADAAPGDPSLIAEGERIAAGGFPTAGVPGCRSCHESAGAAAVAAPNLSGQSALYLRRQLAAMRDESRGATRLWNPMPGVAHVMSDESIAAVAAYYAARPPVAKDAAPAPVRTASAPGGDKAGDAAEGAKLFGTICAKCHTETARGDAAGDFPDLTIQSAAYVATALHAYRSGERENEKMRLVAGNDLDEARIAALGAYLGGLEAKPAMGAAPDAEAAKRGAAIAEKGVVERGVPACLSCHGAEGTAAIPLIAHLHGQNASYLRNKLAYFSGDLADHPSALNPMPTIARRLSTEEQADLAAYFAAQPPLAKAAN